MMSNMKIKLDTLQTKRQQYKKHLQRLSKIYHEDTGKKKILKESRSVDKLLAITHRIHETSSRFKIKKMKNLQRESKSKDWSTIDCSFLPTSRTNHDITMHQRRRQNLEEIEKQNKFLFDRLIKVKPTISASKLQANFCASTRNQFLPRKLKPEADFYSILRASMIKPQNKKIITIKLHRHNQEALKINFSRNQLNFLEEQNVFLFEIIKQNGKIKESECFYGHELFETELCILKFKNQKIEKIELRQLVNETKVIPKGSFQIDNQKYERNKNIEDKLLLTFTNRKSLIIKANIFLKPIKTNIKSWNGNQKSISTQSELKKANYSQVQKSLQYSPTH